MSKEKKEKKGGKKKPLIISAVILAAGAGLFFGFGLPYIQRHFSKVEVNRAEITAMTPVALDGKILTVYFTRVGNTDFEENIDAVSSASLMAENGTLIGNAELLAEMIHNAVGGDIAAIHTEKKYPSGYGDTIDVAKKELDGKETAAILDDLPDPAEYDRIFLVYPLWWGTLPMAVETYLQADLSGKVIYPVVTHGGSREGSSLKDLERLTEANVWKDALVVYDKDVIKAAGQVQNYLQSLTS